MTHEFDVSVVRPDRPGIRKVLGDLEAEVMEAVWARPADAGTRVRDVFEVLYENRRRTGGATIAYTTVMNTMARMARKGLLRVETQEQAYVYSASYTEPEFVSRFVGRVLEDLFVNFAGPTREGVRALQDPQARRRAERLLEEIARRRAAEEPADPAPPATTGEASEGGTGRAPEDPGAPGGG